MHTVRTFPHAATCPHCEWLAETPRELAYHYAAAHPGFYDGNAAAQVSAAVSRFEEITRIDREIRNEADRWGLA